MNRMDVPVKARVRCTDGPAGTAEALIVDATTRALTHFVLRERRWPHIERIVPSSAIESSDEDEIRVAVSLADLASCRRFVWVEVVHVPPADGRDTVSGASHPTLAMPPKDGVDTVLVRHERVPPGGIAIREDAEVDATDGRVGRPAGLIVDARKRVTHVVVVSGHLAPRACAVPVARVEELSDDLVRLRLTRREVGRLPHAPRHDLSTLPGLHEADDALVAESARSAGIVAGEPDTAHIEGARILADEAAARLRSRGFNDEQILSWAEAFLAENGTGDVDGFVAWVERREHEGRTDRPAFGQ